MKLAAAVVVTGVVLLVAVAFVGRWERGRSARIENARMAAVFHTATAEGLTSPLLVRYRLDRQFDCLVYRSPGNPAARAAYELCFDPNGRLIETIDRTSGSPHYASLVEQPSLATLTVPVPRLLAIFSEFGVWEDSQLAGVSHDVSQLPLVGSDLGARPFPRRPKG